jgi:acyl carrier protein
MTEQEVLTRLQPLMINALGVRPEDIAMDRNLVDDLGAESIDLLDLSFLIEEEFGITIEANEFEKEARSRLPGGEYERDGYLTDEALRELQAALPEVPPDRFVQGLRKVEVPSLLNVAVFVHLIQRKIAASESQQSAVSSQPGFRSLTADG